MPRNQYSKNQINRIIIVSHKSLLLTIVDNSNMPLTKNENYTLQTDGRTDPNYRKASLLKMLLKKLKCVHIFLYPDGWHEASAKFAD